MSLSEEYLKAELASLLSAVSADLRRCHGIRTASDRIDSYVSVVRGVLAKSSLCYVDGGLSFFDGRCYCALSQKGMSAILSNVLFDAGVGASDIRKIGDMPMSVVYERSFVGDSNKVCFSNVVYDVEEGRTMPFSKEHITDYCLPYEFSAKARCPRWTRFLSEVMPDVDERSALQEFFGMCFLDRGRLSVEKFAVFVGGGANGKSVVFDVIKRVIGLDRVSFLSPDQLMDNRQVVSVIGKRLNFAPDIRRGASFDSALKALSSGQDVQGWQLYTGNVVVKCPPLVFALNEMPHFRDVTPAFFRRLLLFSFDVTIPPSRQNRRLAAEICSKELGGIFNWVMEGRARLVANNGEFTWCDKMEADKDGLAQRVRGEENPVISYLESIGYGIEPSYDGQVFEKIPCTRIYEGLGGSISKDNITRELNRKGVRHDRGTEVRYFLYRIQ